MDFHTRKFHHFSFTNYKKISPTNKNVYLLEDIPDANNTAESQADNVIGGEFVVNQNNGLIALLRLLTEVNVVVDIWNACWYQFRYHRAKKNSTMTMHSIIKTTTNAHT